MKKFAKWGSIAFVLWFMVSRPSEAAGVVHGTLGGLGGVANNLGTFVSAIP